jgi:hypothetical protein
LFSRSQRRQIQISFRRLPRLLLERVQHQDHFCEGGDADYPESSGTLAKPNLADTRAD